MKNKYGKFHIRSWPPLPPIGEYSAKKNFFSMLPKFSLFWDNIFKLCTFLGICCQDFYYFGKILSKFLLFWDKNWLNFLAKELAKLKSFRKKLAKYALFWEKICTVGGYKVSKLALLRLKFPPPPTSIWQNIHLCLILL